LLKKISELETEIQSQAHYIEELKSETGNKGPEVDVEGYERTIRELQQQIKILENQLGEKERQLQDAEAYILDL
jgi:predicted RNase H-like nuclease (RuvC/YqgF family)